MKVGGRAADEQALCRNMMVMAEGPLLSCHTSLMTDRVLIPLSLSAAELAPCHRLKNKVSSAVKTQSVEKQS